jgi:Fur family ferric uptake transcriptional regulator
VSAEAPVLETVERVVEHLRAHGHRITMPRRAVIDALARAEEHPTVDRIAAEVAERWPGMHLTTVYRTLETLTELGVVSHVHLAAGTAYHLADAAGGRPAHVHAQCRGCHRVIDLPDGVLDDVRRQLDESAGFRLEPHHVALSGLCADCAGD